VNDGFSVTSVDTTPLAVFDEANLSAAELAKRAAGRMRLQASDRAAAEEEAFQAAQEYVLEMKRASTESNSAAEAAEGRAKEQEASEQAAEEDAKRKSRVAAELKARTAQAEMVAKEAAELATNAEADLLAANRASELADKMNDMAAHSTEEAKGTAASAIEAAEHTQEALAAAREQALVTGEAKQQAGELEEKAEAAVQKADEAADEVAEANAKAAALLQESVEATAVAESTATLVVNPANQNQQVAVDASVSSQSPPHLPTAEVDFGASHVLADDGDEWGHIWICSDTGSSDDSSDGSSGEGGGEGGVDGGCWFELKLLRPMSLASFKLRNTHNAAYNDRGTLSYKVELAADSNRAWVTAATGTFAHMNSGSGTQPEQLTVQSDTQQEALFVRFTSLTFQGKGGGLGYFQPFAVGVDTAPAIGSTIAASPSAGNGGDGGDDDVFGLGFGAQVLAIDGKQVRVYTLVHTLIHSRTHTHTLSYTHSYTLVHTLIHSRTHTHALLSYTPLLHSSPTLLSYTPLLHSSRKLLSYTPLVHSSRTLLSYTPLLHSSRTLLSYTPLVHSSPTLLSYTPLLHSSPTLLSYTPLLHSSPTLSLLPMAHRWWQTSQEASYCWHILRPCHISLVLHCYTRTTAVHL
jgi:hypothetical protein